MTNVCPYNFCRFLGQRSDEVILYRAHRHPVHFTYIMVRNTLAALLISGAFLGIVWAIFQAMDLEITSSLLNVGISLLLLYLFATWLMTWTIYYLSLCLVTDTRLIKIVQKGLFYHYTREVKLTGLQDTSYTYNHFLQNMFNYGTITAHTSAGAEGEYNVHYIPNPRDLHHFLNKCNTLIEEANKTGGKADLPCFVPRKRGGWGKKNMPKEDRG